MRGHGPDGATGAALLVSLLLLTVLTVLALAATSDANLQNRMWGNLEQARVSKRTADATLAWAERWLRSIDGSRRPETCSDPCTGDRIIRDAGSYPAAPEYQDPEWWSSQGYPIGRNPVSGEVLDPALAALGGLWIVEELWFEEAAAEEGGERPATGYYRAIALGTAPDGRSASVAESIFARPWGDVAWSDPLPGIPGQTAFCRQLEAETPCGRRAWRRRR